MADRHELAYRNFPSAMADRPTVKTTIYGHPVTFVLDATAIDSYLNHETKDAIERVSGMELAGLPGLRARVEESTSLRQVRNLNISPAVVVPIEFGNKCTRLTLQAADHGCKL